MSDDTALDNITGSGYNGQLNVVMDFTIWTSRALGKLFNFVPLGFSFTEMGRPPCCAVRYNMIMFFKCDNIDM